MSKILVTGADGFTGRHLMDTLLKEGHEVHGLIRSSSSDKHLDPRVNFHYSDLQDLSRLRSVLHECQPERIVHLAAISFVAHGEIDTIYKTNLVGTRNLLEAIDQQSSRPEAVLLASSANVYGNQQAGVIDECARPEPVNDYSVSKLAMEHMAGLYRHRLPIIITRPFNYTGVGQSKNFLIPKIIDHVRRRAPHIELGNIDIERDWSDVRMVAQACARLLETPEAVGRTINICSGRATSLRDMLTLACGLADHQMEIDVNPGFVRVNEVRSLRGDNSVLRGLVDGLPDYPIEDTLRWMLADDA